MNRLNPNILIFIVYGLLYDTVINIYKPFAVKFLERLGGDEFHISLYNSLPGLVAALALVPGIFFISRFKRKKNVTTVFFFISRLFFAVIAFVPLLPEQLRPIAFVLLISFMNFPEALSQTSLQGFLGSVFDGEVRAQAISLRNQYGNFIIPVVTIVTGLIITVFPKDDTQRILFYRAFFAASFIIGLLEIKTFRKFQESSAGGAAIRLEAIGKVLRNAEFLRFSIPTLVATFTWHMGWSLGGIFPIQYLGANEMWLAVMGLAAGAGSFFSAARWNRLIHKKGNQVALALSIVIASLSMFGMVVFPNLWLYIPIWVANGIGTIGINIGVLNGLLSVTPDEDRLLYLGVYNTGVNLSLFIAPLVSLLLIRGIDIVATIYLVGSLRVAAGLIMYLYSKKRGAK